MPVKKNGKKLSSVQLGAFIYKPNDCVFIRGEGDVLPYIARIKEILQGAKGDVQVQVTWFYRPEEASGGRKPFHGEKEVFRSDHDDWCLASTIESKCRVHTLTQYQSLGKVGEADFFARFTYKPATMEFRPDRVPVYCICEMPYNPDKHMVMCEQCEEWYHPNCLGFKGIEEVEAIPNFVCPDCQAYTRDAKRQNTGASALSGHQGAAVS